MQRSVYSVLLISVSLLSGPLASAQTSNNSTDATVEDTNSLRVMVQQLEQRIQRLEARTRISTADDTSKNTAPQATAQNQKTAPTAAVVISRYWLSENADFSQVNEAPLREGRMTMESMISLNPRHYGYRNRGFFDTYLDPSRFPVTAVTINGELLLEQAGVYQLEVKPTPPREVGGAGNVEVSVELDVGGQTVYAMPFSKSLTTRQQTVKLLAGQQPMELRIVARSPGFGPSPTGTKVYIGLQAKGEISPRPLNSYLVR